MTEQERLPILYQDEYFVAVFKPAGLLVHRTYLDKYETRFAMQLVRDQVGEHVFPVHRLDKSTSGVLLFGLSQEAGRLMTEEFTQKRVTKTYLALVRGWTEPEGYIDYPLKKDLDGPLQEAQTAYRTLLKTTVEVPVGRYPSARYSLVEIKPETGRMHQIRRHFAHLRHPVIGDKKHGDRFHNRHFLENWNLPGLFLTARKLEFDHPFSGAKVNIEAEWPEIFVRAGKLIGMEFGEGNSGE